MTQAILQEVTIIVKEDGIYVAPIWANVDRPTGSGYLLKKSHQKLALRLKNALESGGGWIKTPEVRTDIDGKSYVSASCRFYMRTLDADLKKAGF